MYVAGLSAESYCLAVLRIRDINGIFENGLCYFATSKVDEFYSNAAVQDKNEHQWCLNLKHMIVAIGDGYYRLGKP